MPPEIPGPESIVCADCGQPVAGCTCGEEGLESMNSQSAQISPNHVLADFTQAQLSQLETRVMLYEDRMRGWVLRPAQVLLDLPKLAGDFAALTILATYFEPASIYRFGQSSKNKSRQFFVKGFLDVFRGTVVNLDPSPAGLDPPTNFKEKLADLLYRQVRCGLFHQGATGYRIALGRGLNLIHVDIAVRDTPLGWRAALVQVDTLRWLHQIEDHLTDYVARLRDPNESKARAKFMQGWEILHASR
jgi:hypothetical protein